MALTGTPVDLHIRKYKDVIEHELQQKGSVLSALMTQTKGEGTSLSISRMGAIDNAIEVTARWSLIEPDAATFERRIVSPVSISSSSFVDHLDLIRGIDPTSQVVSAISLGLGRKKDALLYAAMSGLAARELDGIPGTVAFDSNNTIAVNSVANASATVVDNGLHEGKIKTALNILAMNFVDLDNDEIVVVGTASQFTKLETRLESLGQLRRDFMDKTPLAQPGLARVLTGYKGLKFIQYQALADAGNLTGGDEYVYIFPKSAMTLATWNEPKVTVEAQTNRHGHPWLINAMMDLGAVRMDEKKMVRVICDI